MGDFVEYFKTKKNLTSLLLLGILILGLPIALQLLKQQQIIKSRAQSSPPIAFIRSDTEFPQSDGSWVTTGSYITFNIYSPLGAPGAAAGTPTPTLSPTPGGSAAPTATPVPTSTPVPTQGENYQLNLVKGWNLISIPRPLADPSVSTFTGFDIADKIYWNNASGGWDYAFRSGVSWSGNISNPEHGKGYWVFANQAGTWNLGLKQAESGNTTVPKYTLKSGWNMVGYTNYKNNEKMLLNDYLKSIGAEKWVKAYRFNKDTQSYDTFAVNAANNPGFDFAEAGRGYWVEIDTGSATREAVPPVVPE